MEGRLDLPQLSFMSSVSAMIFPMLIGGLLEFRRGWVQLAAQLPEQPSAPTEGSWLFYGVFHSAMVPE